MKAEIAVHEMEDRVAMLRDLEKSHERYADLYDFAPFGYLTLDFNGCVRDCNLVAARLLGFERKDLIGHPLMPLLCKEDRLNFLDHLGQLRRGESPVIAELTFLARRGQAPRLQLVSIINRPGPRAQAEFRMALLDVTEQRQTEAVQHQNTQMLEAVVNSSPLAVMVVSRRLRVQVWNPAAERLFGWTRAEVLGKPLPIIPWHQQAAFRELLASELLGKCLIGQEVQRLRKDGALIDVSFSSAPLFDNHGKVASFVRIYEDIRERKRTEHELRKAHETLEEYVAERTAELAESNQLLRQEIADRQMAEAARQDSESRLRAILDNSPAIVFLKDTNGRYLHCNRQFEQVFHVPLAKVIGKTDDELFPPDQAAAFRTNDLDVIQKGLPLQFDEVARREDGQHTAIVSKFPLVDANGKVYGIAGIVTDITERKRLESEVLQISELERQRIGRDLHDGLCQLLAGIRWKNQSLQEDLESRRSNGDVEAARRVAKITSLLSQAIEQARAVAHGLQPIEQTPRGLMLALRQLADLTCELFGVNCSCRIRGPIPVPDHDVATDLFRIAQEAVSNAIKHGKARTVELNLTRQAGNLVLEVTNDGRSFPERRRPSGVGLRTMNYRTLRIGAALHIGPGPGSGANRGTMVRCTLPLSKVLSNGDPSA